MRSGKEVIKYMVMFQKKFSSFRMTWKNNGEDVEYGFQEKAR